MRDELPPIPPEGAVIIGSGVHAAPAGGRSLATRDREVIRQWAQRHSAEPALEDAIERCKDARDEQPEKELARKTKTSEEMKKGQRSIEDIEKKKEAKQKELKSKPGALAVLMQDMDEQIVRLRREIADLATEQDKREKALDIPDRIENGGRCVHYRAGMRELFDDVVKMLEDRKSFSAAAMASKEAEEYAEQIIAHIESEARGHKDQEDGWRNRVLAWRKVLDLKL